MRNQARDFVAQDQRRWTFEPHLLSSRLDFAAHEQGPATSVQWSLRKSQDHTSSWKKDPGERPQEVRKALESLSSRFQVSRALPRGAGRRPSGAGAPTPGWAAHAPELGTQRGVVQR